MKKTTCVANTLRYWYRYCGNFLVITIISTVYQPPIPAGYLHIKNGEHIAVKSQLQFNNGKPLFLHFFNPDCPCSRFNITHFKALVERYGNQSNFVVVVMTNKNYTPAEIKERFHLNVPVISDSALAAACGVYSTPAGRYYYSR